MSDDSGYNNREERDYSGYYYSGTYDESRMCRTYNDSTIQLSKSKCIRVPVKDADIIELVFLWNTTSNNDLPIVVD